MRKLLVLTVLAWASIAAMADGRTEQVAQLGHFRDCDVCSEMVVLPAGKYMMGATKGEFEGQEKYSFMYNDETPRHEEYVKSFAIAKFDVTRRQFAIFAMETGFRGKGCEIFDGKTWITDANADWQNPGFRQTDNDPVVCVSWNDVQKYIAWLNSQLTKNKGIAYRLPTEAEWEYAARAGTVTAAYWGNNPPDQCEYENARDESARFLDPTIDHAPCTDGYIYTAPVGSFKPNPWGLFDMLGNAEQWVGDCVNFGYHSPPNLSASPDACKSRALRGTSWAGIPVSVRSASRSGMPANARVSNFGFRIARSIQH
ncbi:formylglycine-generating enzyme family protein [Paraburkholderia caffeinitolerans]|nr:formylglycine-generating enzyme family protein [Paraburkholderia caffeinitolerans]